MWMATTFVGKDMISIKANLHGLYQVIAYANTEIKAVALKKCLLKRLMFMQNAATIHMA